MLITWKVYIVRSYGLQLWCDDSHIIVLHLQGILCHGGSGLGGASAQVDYVRKSPHFGGLSFSTGGLL